MFFSQVLMAAILSVGAIVSDAASAANLARGKSLYLTTPNKFAIPFNCADTGCHTANPSANVKLNGKGSNAAAIKTAINGGVPTMGLYGPVNGTGNLSDADLADIAAYIGNPAAGAILNVSTNTLTFPPTAFGALPPSQIITATNAGLASLNVTSAIMSGSNAADFAVTNHCTGAVASNGTCTIAVALSTAVSGSKSATLTIASNGGSQAVTVNGTVSGAPSVSLNSPTGGLTFPNTTIGSTSTANNLPPSGVVTLTNTGSAALNISALTPSVGFTLDQTPATSCKISTPVNASQTCTLNVKFAPGSAGLKTGSLSIAHNGSASPTAIVLSGTGVAASAPTPAATLDRTTLTFGDQTVGTTSAVQQVILSNGGSKPLTLTSILDSNAEFRRTGTCATGQIVVGGNCTIVVVFSPSSVASMSATVTITDDAGNVAGTTQVISLSGTGKSTALPAPTLTTQALDFGIQSLNTASTAKVITITNTSAADALAISALSLVGSGALEYAIDAAAANACATTAAVLASASCSITVKFVPTASGVRDAALQITTNATGSPHTVSLTGSGSTAVGTTPTPTVSANVGGGGCALRSSDEFDPVLLSLFLLGIISAMARRRQLSRNLVALSSRKFPLSSNR